MLPILSGKKNRLSAALVSNSNQKLSSAALQFMLRSNLKLPDLDC